MSLSKDIVLIGGGGHCRSVLDSVNSLHRYENVYVIDKTGVGEELLLEYRVSGGDELLPVLYVKGCRKAIITVGSIKDTSLRHRLAEKASSIGYGFDTIIDPSAVISDSSVLGGGVFIGKNAIVNACCTVGDHAIINSGAIIEHECRIGAFTHVAVGATVCGDCEIGSDVLIGANSTVIQGIKIGNKCVIGAGSIVLADVPAGMTVVGVWSPRAAMEYQKEH